MTGRHRADEPDGSPSDQAPEGFSPVPARREDAAEHVADRPPPPTVGVSSATLLLTLGVGILATTALCVAALLRR